MILSKNSCSLFFFLYLNLFTCSNCCCFFFIILTDLIAFFTFVSNTQYFNPAYLILGYHTYHAETDLGTQIILLIKGKVIRNKDEIKDMRFHRLNDTTYISRKVSGEENE